jgi:thiol-disulfide isomerase/thioredoxin
MKNRLTIFTLIIIGCIAFSWSNGAAEGEAGVKAIFKECETLYKEGKYDTLLALVDRNVEKYPDYRLNFIHIKYNVLLETKRYKEAIDVAIERDRLYGRTSPKKSLDVVRLYIYLKDFKNAYKWLDITAARGYQNFSVLENYDLFKPLRVDRRFDPLIAKIKTNVGVGKPVKQFTRTTLDGQTVSPAAYKGKVLLIDFWALYCPPCLKGIDHMKTYYHKYKQKGFEVLGINLDSSREKLEKYIDEKKIEWPIIFSGKGWKDETRKLFNLVNIPAYWLVDKKGILRYVGLEGEELKKAILTLLEE